MLRPNPGFPLGLAPQRRPNKILSFRVDHFLSYANGRVYRGRLADPNKRLIYAHD